MNKKLASSAAALALTGALATTSHAQASSARATSAAHDDYTAYSAAPTGARPASTNTFMMRGAQQLLQLFRSDTCAQAYSIAAFAGTVGAKAPAHVNTERLFDEAGPR